MTSTPDDPRPDSAPAPDWSQAWADYYAWWAQAAAYGRRAGQTWASGSAGWYGAPPTVAPGPAMAPETTAPAMVATSSTAYAVELVATRPAHSSRTWAVLSLLLVKTVALLPHLLLLTIFLVVGAIAFLMAQVAVLFTARYPRSLYAFVAGVLRWQVRVRAFALGLSDRYPPFVLDSSDKPAYPVDLIVHRPARSSRLWAVNYFLSVVSVAYYVHPSAALWLTTRTAATLPHVFILLPLSAAVFWAWLVAQFIVVGRGTYPRGLYEYIAGCLRWTARVEAFWFGLTDAYPPFELVSDPVRSQAPDVPR